jgi:hypothetical protein
MMRILITFLLAVSLFVLCGCEEAKNGASKGPQEVASPAGRGNSQATHSAAKPESAASAGFVTTIGGRETQVSLEGASAVQAATLAVDRKIIRNADLTIETDSPTDGLRKITSIAEAHGGFVVTSEFKQNDPSGQPKATQTVTVVARVPSPQFNGALEQIRAAGNRVIQEKVSGQDVSEEYLDLEARIRTKKALEAQFLEIMKQARKVSDALEVQSQLADVRTEIERFEGRRRFLENQSALSTITATLQMPAPLVAATTTGFGHSIKQAFGDAVDIAASIILFVIQAVIVLVPIGLLVVLPVWLVWRALRRRFVWTKKAEPVAESQ